MTDSLDDRIMLVIPVKGAWSLAKYSDMHDALQLKKNEMTDGRILEGYDDGMEALSLFCDDDGLRKRLAVNERATLIFRAQSHGIWTFAARMANVLGPVVLIDDEVDFTLEAAARMLKMAEERSSRWSTEEK
jgi:hypothetical protein